MFELRICTVAWDYYSCSLFFPVEFVHIIHKADIPTARETIEIGETYHEYEKLNKGNWVSR